MQQPADPPSDRTPASHHLDPASRHPDEDALELYALGRLPESEAAVIEEHLLLCVPCQNALTELDEYVGAMKSGLRESEAAKVKAPAGPRRLVPVLAGVVVALGVGFVLTQPGRRSEPVELTLRSLRGGGPEMAEAPAGAPLRLRLQSEQRALDPTYRVRIVDAKGSEIWSGPAPANGDLLQVEKTLEAGMHWVRLYDANGVQVLEYGLQVK